MTNHRGQSERLTVGLVTPIAQVILNRRNMLFTLSVARLVVAATRDPTPHLSERSAAP